nr:Increased rDNA silencing protein [Ipomoea batatas]
MAHPQLHLLIITLALAAGVNISASYVLKGSVSCMDCNAHHDLSGIKVSVKCSHEKKLGVAITEEDGSFDTTVASNPPPSAGGCSAKILGATQQLYAPKTAESKIVEADGHYYTTSEPLRFYTKCPNEKCGSPKSGLGSSKTFEVPPLPREWAPTASLIMPFFPIIGIP